MKKIQRLHEILSHIPKENNGKNIDKQLLRIGIIAETDAVNLYEQLAELATDDDVKNVLLDVDRNLVKELLLKIRKM